MSTSDVLAWLASRFRDLAGRSGDLRITWTRCGDRDTFQAPPAATWRQLAKAAAEALSLIEPGNAGGCEAFVRWVFQHRVQDATTVHATPVELIDDAGRATKATWWRQEIQNAALAAAMALESAKPAGPEEAAAAAAGQQGQLSAEARALAILTQNPGWTNQQIADAAGVRRSSLYRMQRFLQARQAAKDAGRAKMTRRRDIK